MTSPGSWGDRRAPGIDEFETIARRVFDGLDAAFRQACGDVVIRVEEFPDEDVAKAMELESEFDLLGLFEGVGLPQRGESASGAMPNMIWLYRRPILDYWAEFDETLGQIIAHVLIHEIGHHMGFSDDDMERIETAAGIA